MREGQVSLEKARDLNIDKKHLNPALLRLTSLYCSVGCYQFSLRDTKNILVVQPTLAGMFCFYTRFKLKKRYKKLKQQY